jgi:hypothetical protein
VVDGVSGYHFRVNSATDLADRIEMCASQPEAWRSMCAQLPRPPAVEETVDRLLSLYAETREQAVSAVSRGNGRSVALL